MLALICLIPVLILVGAEIAYIIEGLKTSEDRRPAHEKQEYRDEPEDAQNH